MGFGGSSSGGGAISTAADVALSTPQNNEVLTYDSVSSKWKNSIASAAGSAPGIEDLPAGSTLRVLSPTTARPTTRTDISVIWIGYSNAPVNALQGDMWLEPIA